MLVSTDNSLSLSLSFLSSCTQIIREAPLKWSFFGLSRFVKDVSIVDRFLEKSEADLEFCIDVTISKKKKFQQISLNFYTLSFRYCLPAKGHMSQKQSEGKGDIMFSETYNKNLIPSVAEKLFE